MNWYGKSFNPTFFGENVVTAVDTFEFPTVLL